jgi:hypothetical protein
METDNIKCKGYQTTECELCIRKDINHDVRLVNWIGHTDTFGIFTCPRYLPFMGKI